jgi:hypothetical protein
MPFASLSALSLMLSSCNAKGVRAHHVGGGGGQFVGRRQLRAEVTVSPINYLLCLSTGQVIGGAFPSGYPFGFLLNLGPSETKSVRSLWASARQPVCGGLQLFGGRGKRSAAALRAAALSKSSL